MIPDKFRVRREEDYHTHYVGECMDGQKFIGFPFFAETGQKRPLAVLHLFDQDGSLLSTQVWEEDKMYLSEAKLKEAIENLPGIKYKDIELSPFVIEHHDLLFGFVPSRDDTCLEYVPYGLLFTPPWDGTYDT